MEILKIDDEENDLYCYDVAAKTAFENFGIKYMFPWQRLVVANILEAYEIQKSGVDINQETDSFCKGRQIVLLPTGAGKSLCFQVPALLLDGPTMVIYPLLALMTDQQRRMEEGALKCVVFRGGQSKEEQENNFNKLKEGAQIILANPEVLQNEELVTRLSKAGIKHIAIDEAHCVSEWGDSFRPAYLTLGKVIEKINPPMITAFTATASPSVLSRVAEILFNGEAHIVRSESDRPNIHYFVKYAAAKKKEALYLAKTEDRPMIIFCGTRNNTEDMCRELNMAFGYEIARFYHAGLEKSEKDETEKWFFNSKDGILCATCAYGMGVDKKDIHTVVHLEASTTAEAYIQEAGRGGRDGSVAKGILIWSLADSLKFSQYPDNSRERSMMKFAETKDCRRQVLLDALGAEQAVCAGCDNCNNKKNQEQNIKIKKSKTDFQKTYELIKRSRNYYTIDEIESTIFQQFNNDTKKLWNRNLWTHGDVTEVITQLMENGLVECDKLLWKGRLRAKKILNQVQDNLFS